MNNCNRNGFSRVVCALAALVCMTLGPNPGKVGGPVFQMQIGYRWR